MLTRRKFLHGAGALLAAPAFVPAPEIAPPNPISPGYHTVTGYGAYGEPKSYTFEDLPRVSYGR